MIDCLFCKIRDGQIPARLLHQDDRALAFADIAPHAPLHALVIPRRHIPTLLDLTPDDDALVGHLHRIAVKLARDAGYADDGFRVVFNCNRAAGQSVWHIHLHVMAGRTFQWPPG